MTELNQYPIDPYSLAKLFASYNPEEEARKELFIKNCPHIEYEQDMGASIPFCRIDGNMCNGQCLKTPQRDATPPKTNADRIRAMSDEELAEVITDDWCEIVCSGTDYLCRDGTCEQHVLKWLKEEVKE